MDDVPWGAAAFSGRQPVIGVRVSCMIHCCDEHAAHSECSAKVKRPPFVLQQHSHGDVYRTQAATQTRSLLQLIRAFMSNK